MLLSLLLACADDPAEPPAGEVTWHADVRPIVERACLDCHVAGGLAPLDLSYDAADWEDGAPGWAGAAVAAVEARRMPPWPASSDCHPVAHSRALSDAEIATFTAWAAAGLPEGDPLDFVAPLRDPQPTPVGEPDLSLSFPRPYVPLTLLPDDYYCAVVGDVFEEEAWVTASRIVPGEEALVHHVIAYLVEPAGVPEVLAAAGEAGGYTCFGGPLPSGSGSSAYTFAGYVPGQASEVLLDGDARPVPAGSLFVLQMHYNTLSAPDPLPADDTRLDLWTRPEPPNRVVLTTGVANYDFVIPAGDPNFRASVDVNFGVAADVLSVLGHLHTRGTSLTVEAIHPDGSSSCVLDIPRWDFDWQLQYAFPGDQPFRLGAADAVRLSCGWDNSASNQPVVNGEQLPPQNVGWGEGTTDEMCIAFAAYAIPYGATQGCDPIAACHGATCAEGDGQCVADCWERSLSECGLCVADGVLDCGADSCQLPGLGLVSCAETLCQGLDTITCLGGPCREELEAYLSCQDPNVRDGSCDPWLEACEVSFGP